MTRWYIYGMLVVLILLSCSTNKGLQQGEVLYRGERINFERVLHPDSTKWKINEASEKYAKVYWDLWDTPNGALLGMPFTTFIPLRLYIYNLFYNEKEKGFSVWMRDNFGEPPKSIRYINPELKVNKGISVFENYGHFGTTGHYRLIYNNKKNKAYLRYYFQIPKAYTYHKVEFNGVDSFSIFNSSIDEFSRKTILKLNDEFNLYRIREDCNNLWKQLQNDGFYFIRQKDIEVRADTTLGYKKVHIKIGVNDALQKEVYNPQTLTRIELIIDTVVQPGLPEKYYHWGFGKLKSHIIDSVLSIRPYSRYSLAHSKKSLKYLSDLGVFSNPRIEYKVVEGDSSKLQTSIKLDVLDATNIGFNIRGNYKTAGYLGPSIGFTFKQLNIFSGAENLYVSGDVYYDFPFGVFKDRVSRSAGYSIRSELLIPLLRSPFGIIKHEYRLPKRFYTLNFDYNIRIDYFDILALNTAYGWQWQNKPNVKHKLNLVDITYSNIFKPTARFGELVSKNPMLRVTLVDQLMLGSSYEFKYKRLATFDRKWELKYSGRIDLSGNTLDLINKLVTNTPAGSREVLGINYSQFTRLTSEFIANWHIGKIHQLVFRNIAGIGLAYGNSEQIPYIKQYFIGGTNSLRPVTARTIGPGRYLEFNEGEVNQVGDLKLEFNIEYRMPLLWKLNLAIFADAGNIWLLRDDPAREGGQVRWNRLINDMYLTTGLGLRLDIKYLVLRFDYGVMLYAPIFIKGYKWIWQNQLPLYGGVIGIGYPF